MGEIELGKKILADNETSFVTYNTKTDKVLFVSEKLLNLTGYTRIEFRDLLDDNYSNIIYKDDMYILDNINYSDLKNKSLYLNYRLVHKDGHLIFISENRHAYLSDDDYIAQIDILNVSDLEKQIGNQQRLIDCAKLLASNQDFTTIINKVIKIVCDHYKAERVDIFKRTPDNNLVRKYSFSKVESPKGALETYPYSLVTEWINSCEKNASYRLLTEADIPVLQEYDCIRETFRILNVKRIILIPIFYQKQFYGILSITNPVDNLIDAYFLITLSYLIVHSMEKENLTSSLKNLSYQDSLTALQNRNAYLLLENKYKDIEIEKIGVIFADLNNLKFTNDNYGHAQGDILIRNFANTLLKHFRHNEIYRISGDEFIVICLNSNRKDFLHSLKALQYDNDAENKMASIGYCYKETNTTIKEAVFQAEQIMYSDKGNYYHAQESSSELVSSNIVNLINENRLYQKAVPILDVKRRGITGVEMISYYLDKNGNEKHFLMFFDEISAHHSANVLEKELFRVLCKRISEFSTSNHKLPVFTYNLSILTFLEPDISVYFDQICKKYNVSNETFTFIINKVAGKIDMDYLNSKMKEFNDLGYRISLNAVEDRIDNLCNLNSEYIKYIFFDYKVVTGSLTDFKQEVSINTLIDIGHSLNQKVIVNNVPTDDDIQILSDLKCDLYSKSFLIDAFSIEDLFENYINQDKIIKPTISQSTIYLENAFSFFNDFADVIYIIDNDTHELLFMNKNALSLCIKKDYFGKKCYHFLKGRNKVCDNCKYKIEHNLSRTYYHKPTGQTFDIKSSKIVFQGKSLCIMIFSDVTEMIKNKNKIKEQAKDLRNVIKYMPIGMSLYRYKDRSITKILGNNKVEQMLGDTEKNFNTNIERYYNNIEPSYIPTFRKIISDLCNDSKEAHTIFPFRHFISGQIVWIELNGHIVDSIDNSKLIYVTYTDITNQKTLQEKLENSLYVDSLTGLKNRACYDTFLSSISSTGKQSAGAIYVDCNDIKHINYVYGHQCGDETIKKASEILYNTFNSDYTFRISGDEFVIFCFNHSYEWIEDKIKFIKEKIYKKGSPLFSIGFSYEENVSDYVKLISNAEKMMLIDKQKFYTKNSDLKKHKASVLKPLIEGIENEQYLLYLQPIFDTRNNCVNKAESLVRYKNVNDTIITPNQFIPVLEEEMVISRLDLHIFRKTCMFLQNNCQDGKISISVNCSRISLMDQDFIPSCIEICDEYKIDRSQIIFEVTESIAAIDRNTLLKSLNVIHDSGFKVALDDMGAGFSGLELLISAPIDFVKIDKSLIDKITTDPKVLDLITMIINFCHNQHISVVSEGIEEKDQFELLKEAKCDFIQGYLISKPIFEDEFKDKYIK